MPIRALSFIDNDMLIAAIIIVIVLAVAVSLAFMGPTFGVFGVGNFRANKRFTKEPPTNE